MPDATKVGTGAAKTGGAVYMAATTVAMPTDTTTELTDWTDLGCVSEDGLENSDTRTSTDIKDWEGNVVDSSVEKDGDKFTFTLIEALNADVMKLAHGDSAVTGDLTSGISVAVGAADATHRAFCFDMIIKKHAKRVVVPDAMVTNVEAISYKKTEAVGYKFTITAYPDSSGVTHHEYIK